MQRHCTETAKFMDLVFADLCHAVQAEAALAVGEDLCEKLKALVARFLHALDELERAHPDEVLARRYAKWGLGKYGERRDLAVTTPAMLATIIIDGELHEEVHVLAGDGPITPAGSPDKTAAVDSPALDSPHTLLRRSSSNQSLGCSVASGGSGHQTQGGIALPPNPNPNPSPNPSPNPTLTLISP